MASLVTRSPFLPSLAPIVALCCGVACGGAGDESADDREDGRSASSAGSAGKAAAAGRSGGGPGGSSPGIAGSAGTNAAGGASAGGATAAGAGGSNDAGGGPAAGGTQAAGGTPAAGGSQATGGTQAAGGSGAAAGAGGNADGGKAGASGSSSNPAMGAPPPANKADLPAFPGAEGAGSRAKGGRGGDVYHVTNTKDSGPGSLRNGVAGSGARTIVFDVGGIITLASPLSIKRDSLTIAGQTAPGDGIVVRGWQTVVAADDFVLRHVRFRGGDLQKKKSKNGDGFTEDSLTLNGTRVIVDHVSASWGIDESLSGGSEFDRLTVQYCIIAEGLRKTCLFHGEYDCSHPGHSMGSLFKTKGGSPTFTIHHNLYASNNNRNPAIGGYEASQVVVADIRNNVLYNTPSRGYSSGLSKQTSLNYVGNVFIAGPDNDSGDKSLFDADPEDKLTIWASGNARDLDRNGKISLSSVGWEAIEGTYDKAGKEHATAAVTTHPAAEAFTLVTTNAGARPWNRDAPDARILDNVATGKGKLVDSQEDVGGYGTVATGTTPKDTDGDGMPDAWETAYGTNPAKDDNNGDLDGDGWTNLEEYLHDAANP